MLTDNILDLIGNTPLVRLKGENIFAKAEFLNPGGSIKDRVALAMLEGAERDGRLKPDSIIVEPTSGNTGIGVALIGRLKGYQVRIVMPQGMSEERKKIIRALGAELILTPDEESIGGAVRRVREIAAADPRVFVPQQFENPDNPRCHYETTAQELWRQTGGEVDCFVAGVGSGGTLQGVGKFLKEHKPDVHHRGRRAEGRLRPAGPRAGPAPDPGHRRRLHPRRAGHLAGRRGHRGDRRGRHRDHAAVGPRSGPAGGHLLGRQRLGRPASRRHAVQGNIATILPDRAERYFSTALL